MTTFRVGVGLQPSLLSQFRFGQIRVHIILRSILIRDGYFGFHFYFGSLFSGEKHISCKVLRSGIRTESTDTSLFYQLQSYLLPLFLSQTLTSISVLIGNFVGCYIGPKYCYFLCFIISFIDLQFIFVIPPFIMRFVSTNMMVPSILAMGVLLFWLTLKFM